jgi:hypothetical protein
LRQGTIPAVLIGRQWRIRKSAIDGWLAEQERAVKVIKQHGGHRPGEDRLSRAAAYRPEDLSLPKPPRQQRTVEEVGPGARKPRSESAPAESSPVERRKLAREALQRDRQERGAKGRA